MTVTLDGKTLDCKQLSEDCAVISTQWDAWINSAYKRKLKVLGTVRTWTLHCMENGVAWTSSSAKSLENSAANGTTLTFSVTDEVRIIGTSVYVLGVSIDAVDLAGKNIRYFTITLQEV
jgi:hypothetical protein